jgi:flagellar motor switch protein FliN/FliY
MPEAKPEAKPDKPNYLECWIRVAASLFSQALAGEPVLEESLPKPMSSASFGFAATIDGDEAGRFSVLLDSTILETPLLGEGQDQQAGWAELLKEIADAAAGELLSKTGRKAHVTAFAAIASESKLSRAFQLKAGDRSWPIQVNSEVRISKPAPPPSQPRAAAEPAQKPAAPKTQPSASATWDGAAKGLSPALELLLDVELEASLRFGAKEMPLGEILELGPGDVVQLDRHINDPVDLIVGDKIIARGEVVLVNGNFGLRVTEVAEPQKRLESIRCLF